MKTDFIGREIKPGHLVGFSKGNEPDLHAAIVIEIEDDILRYLIKSRKAIYAPLSKGDILRWKNRKKRFSHRISKPKGKFLGWGEYRAKKSSIKIKKEKLQGRLVLIEEPLFALNNDNIAAQIEIMDMAIDQGLLPKGYKLGVPFE